MFGRSSKRSRESGGRGFSAGSSEFSTGVLGTNLSAMTVVSIVVMACLLLSTLVVLVGIASDDRGKRSDRGIPSAAGEPAEPPEAARAAAEVGPSGGSVSPAQTEIEDPYGPCPPTGPSNDRVPTQEPSEVEWEDYHGLALPTSPTSGPLVYVGSVARCYAHSPTGALLAAAQISARALLAGDWAAVGSHQIEPGPASAEYHSRMTRLKGTTVVPRWGRDLDGLMEPAGFRFLSYSDQQAVIVLAYATEGGLLKSAVYTVVRGTHDWLLRAEPDGSIGALVQNPSSLEGFVPWGRE